MAASSSATRIPSRTGSRPASAAMKSRSSDVGKSKTPPSHSTEPKTGELTPRCDRITQYKAAEGQERIDPEERDANAPKHNADVAKNTLSRLANMRSGHGHECGPSSDSARYHSGHDASRYMSDLIAVRDRGAGSIAHVAICPDASSGSDRPLETIVAARR
jgi:hypothetical protein